jgi:cell division protein FtsI (penicillin-binding protein 3)
VYLQIFKHDHYSKLAQKQHEREMTILAPRGAILDRSGRPLALSLPADSVCINPRQVPDPLLASDILSGILKLDKRELLAEIERANRTGRGFLWVKRRVTAEEARRLRQYGLTWVGFRPESRRFYPKGTLAAHVIGSVDFEEKGNGGVELSLNRDLEGKPGRMRLVSDVRQRGFESQVSAEPQAGKSVTLTIDERIQYVADRELKKAVVGHKAVTGSLVVLDVRTGDILALANYPTFDPNRPPESEKDVRARVNLAISTPFEPGSVFKVVSIAGAMDSTRLRPDTLIDCGGGRLNLFGRTIREAKRGFGLLPVEEVLARSSNIGAIQISRRIGEAKLHEYVRAFGFGRETGLPLPAESAGTVRNLKRWSKSSIGSVAMGHEVSTTTLQLAQACSVVANGGLLIRPRLVLSRQRPGGPPELEPVASPVRVLKPETAITMRRMMESVVLQPYGTGRKARLTGYTAGGKTGSAQIFDLTTKQYRHHYYNASFMGFAPVTKPAIVVVVTLNGATEFGGAVAAPVFREVAMAALRMLDVPKDLPDLTPPEIAGNADENDLAIAELATPDLPPEAPEVEPAPVTPEPASLAVVGPKVPDFQGKSMRAVMQESAARGLPVDYFGTGLARAQEPPPGSVLPPGERIRVQFAR